MSTRRRNWLGKRRRGGCACVCWLSGAWSGEVWNRHKSGAIFLEWLTITAVQTEDGKVTHYVSTLTDITQRKAAEDEIRHLAFYDPLTRLPNRRLLLDRLHQALLTSRRTPNPFQMAQWRTFRLPEQL